MVAAPRDLANFFFHLLDEDIAKQDDSPLLSAASRHEMQQFHKFTAGWEAGQIQYGAGLMLLGYGNSRSLVLVVGHEGDTYGFVSSQGYVPNLKAAYSIASNIDNDTPMEAMACYLHQISQREIGGSKQDLGCKMLGEPLFV